MTDILTYLRGLPVPDALHPPDARVQTRLLPASTLEGATAAVTTRSEQIAGISDIDDARSMIGDLTDAYLKDQSEAVRQGLRNSLPAYASGPAVDRLLGVLGTERMPGELDDVALCRAIEQDLRPYPVGSYRYLEWIAKQYDDRILDAEADSTGLRITGAEFSALFRTVIEPLQTWINDPAGGRVLITDPTVLVTAPYRQYSWAVTVTYRAEAVSEHAMLARVIDAGVEYNRMQSNFQPVRYVSDLIEALAYVPDTVNVVVTRFAYANQFTVPSTGTLARSDTSDPSRPIIPRRRIGAGSGTSGNRHAVRLVAV